MECTGENFFQLQGEKTAPLKFGLFDQIFLFLPKVVALDLTQCYRPPIVLRKKIPVSERTVFLV